MKLNVIRENDNASEISPNIKNIIDNYINKYDAIDYEEKIKQDINFDELYYLSSSSQNIVNWYQFKNTDTVLEIGGDLGERTGVYIEKCKNVTTIEPNLEKAKAIEKRFKKSNNLEILVGSLLDANIEERFDYVILIDFIGKISELFGKELNFTEILKVCEKYLKPDGTILVAVDNQFGLRYFSGNPDNVLNRKFEIINGYNNSSSKFETFSKGKLDRIFQENDYKVNFYYPLPDYRISNVIFSDDELPKYTNIAKYNPYYLEKSTLLINEIDIFREILKDNEFLFKYLTNSYFMEIKKNKIDPIKFKYISYNNLRKSEYRLITKISDQYVEKEYVNKLSKNHYDNIIKNIKYLLENNIKTVDYVENDILRSKYINEDYMLTNVLSNYLEQGNFEGFYQIIEKYLDLLKMNSYKESNYKKTVFHKYDIKCENKDIIKDMHFVKKGLWDMTFSNCFYINGEFLFFDQEWEEENLPIEYILYRSIFYTITLRRFVNIEVLFDKYNLQKYRNLFEQLDNVLQEKIRDDKIWNYYNQNKMFNIDDTAQEVINLNIRSEAKDGAIQNLQNEIEKLKKKTKRRW